MLADARLGPAAVRRLEQDVDGAVEFLLGRLDVPVLQLLLAGLESAFGGGDEGQDGVFDAERRLGQAARRVAEPAAVAG